MTSPKLVPHGAARALFGAPSATDQPFPDELVTVAREADLGEERLHLAWELARLTGARGDDHRGLLVVLLLLFDAIAQGSTWLSLETTELRARAAVLGLSKADVRRAETCAEKFVRGLDGRGARAGSQLALDRGASDAWSALLEGDRAPLVIAARADRVVLGTQRLAALEARLERALASRVAATIDEGALAAAVAEVLASPTPGAKGIVSLTDEQQRAVGAALRGPVAVVSGGPGTGKTSIVVAMLRALARMETGPLSIALAAPTGKAADRMAQAIGRGLAACVDPRDVALRASLPEPRTLHRLLGWSPSEERFRHHAGSPLAERVVIVDEASMIDVALMERIALALRPDARLVLLGDADQLPSIEPGAVLADLVRASESRAPLGGVSIARLTRSHRMDPSDPSGSHVLSIAAMVNEGRAPGTANEPRTANAIWSVPVPPPSGAAPEGVAIAAPRDALAREAWLAWWYEHRVRGGATEREAFERSYEPSDPADVPALTKLFERLEASRLLCVTRGRATGADAINAWMGARLARERRAPAGGLLQIGEPAMVLRNDYDAGLFNGDTGLVLWVGAPGQARATFVARRGAGFVAHPLENVRWLLERAYASTVHKAQGSEHDQVALVLPEDDVPRLLTREIVYTAITRARRSVLILGRSDLLARAIGRRAARVTGLAAG